MTENDATRVVRTVAINSWFKSRHYESFTRAVMYLLRKYGVAGYTDTELAEKIYEQDNQRVLFAPYLCASEIRDLLAGYGNLSEEQVKNRCEIKGALNV